MSVPETIQRLMSDKSAFDSYVYTPLGDAIAELERRQTDRALETYVERSLPQGIPSCVQGEKNIVLFRHIATPNYETHRFMWCADVLTDFNPLILEYTEDQFNDRNQNKSLLGKLRFQKGLSKHGDPIFEKVNTINFNKSNNKPLSTISTDWGQPLVDFHHGLFTERFKDFTRCFHDISGWLHLYGMTAKEYYKPFFTLFLRNGILFENIRLDEMERSFTESIMLPAFCSIEEECGYKPLIVQLAPGEVETDDFWYSHPYSTKATVDKKLGGQGVSPRGPLVS